MKNKNKIIIYLLSGIIPLMLFSICAYLNDFLPFGKIFLNIYDSYTQYSGILLEYKQLLLKGNIFYSWNGGLGFNFLGTMLYYCASPLNLFSLLATSTNYPYFISYMTLGRILLLGLSMCFYLDKRGTKPQYTVLFSTIYALMGYTATYYYNFLWIDSIIMLPLVIHGLDKILENKSPIFYIVTLTITILINFYTAYMICIFIVIYFTYNIVNIKNKKTIIKTFIISSLLCGIIGALSLLPAYYALKTGKAKLYTNTTYGGINRNFTTFFYTLTSGEYFYGDQSYGPAQVYTSILAVVLSIFYFFNKNFTKKEKIMTGAILLFFFLSFSVNILNYAWQFFQKPIWWQSRFSFLFSFFIIIVALKTLENIDKTDFKLSYRIIASILFIIACTIGIYFKMQVQNSKEVYTFIYLGLSLIIFIEEILLLDKKYAWSLILVFTLIDLSINTFNSLKQNNRGTPITYYIGLREQFPNTLEKLNEENNNEFFRLDFINDYLSNDGMYFNFHGVNYFNSVRNMAVIDFLGNLGQKASDHCHIIIDSFDPVFLSLFNIKYLYGNLDYFTKYGEGITENPYPLSIGIVGSTNVKDVQIVDSEYRENLNRLVSGILGYDAKLYKHIDEKEFILKNVYIKDNKYLLEKDAVSGLVFYTFTADTDYMIMPNDKYVSIYVNNEEKTFDNSFIRCKKGDVVEIDFRIYGKTEKEDIYIDLLDYSQYETVMQELSKELMTAYTYKNGHIIEGTVTVSKDNSYLFTTIEHENGMKVYVDGKKVDYDLIGDVLIGIPLNKGTHTIYIDYIPKGLIPGALLSFTGIITTVLYLQIRKKHL